MTGIGQGAPRRHRGAFWTAVLVALALIVAGGLLVANSYARTARPADVVEQYFAALERGDAPAALALGTVPNGSRGLLTSEVLRVQQSVAHIRQVSILSTSQHGSRADVDVQYQLTFPNAASQLITDTVPVVQRGQLWRLAKAAALVRLQVQTARDRATLAGAKLPTAPVFAFPGAPPITFDTPVLAITSGVIRFTDYSLIQVNVGVSQAGRTSLNQAVDAAVRACLSGQAADPLCPSQINGRRTVPGSLRGTLIGSATVNAQLSSGQPADWGVIDLTGSFRAQARFSELDSNNLASPQHGEVEVNLKARVLASEPQKIVWEAS